MNLKELKKMIAEEYSAYTKQVKEQDLPGMPLGGDAPGVAVSDMDVDAMGGEDSEKILKDIFDMLKDYFEGDKDDTDTAADTAADTADDADDTKDDATDDAEDVEEGKHDKDKDDLKEGHCYDEDGKPMPEAHCMEEGKKNNLQERFQKLANIIK